MENVALGFIWFVIFVFSTTLHEAAHALVAMKLGDQTAYRAGQVTIDPLPHIQREPLGMIVVPIISFIFTGFTWMLGWASAPYDPLWAGRFPRKAAIMALAGPVSNLLLMLIAIVGVHIGLSIDAFFLPDTITTNSIVGVYAQTGVAKVMGTLLSILFTLNLVLFIFNLLPLPPLDGSSLFGLFTSRDTAVRIMNFLHQPGFAMFGIFIAWMFFGEIYSPIRLFVINNLLYPGSDFGVH